MVRANNLGFTPKDYDNLTNHERYWLLVDLARDEMHAAQEPWAEANAGTPFSAFTPEMQRNILSWLNRKGKSLLPKFSDYPQKVKEKYDDVMAAAEADAQRQR